MSTRSSKRIHNYFHEDEDKTTKSIDNIFSKNDRKTRSKRVKETVNEESERGESRRRQNYVSYPAEEHGERADPQHDPEENPISHQENTKNPTNKVSENKRGRLTRQTKKFTEFQEIIIDSNILSDVSNKKNKKENIPNGVVDELQETIETLNKKSKKGKKKKNNQKFTEQDENEAAEVEEPVLIKKKSKKKKNAKKSSVVTESGTEDKKNNILNKSAMSVDSFHSAAGSPAKDDNTSFHDKDRGRISLSKSNSFKEIFMSTEVEPHNEIIHSAKKRKASIKAAKEKDTNVSVEISKDDYDVVDNVMCSTILTERNSSLAKDNRKRKSSVKEDVTKANNTTFEKQLAMPTKENEQCNLTFESQNGTSETCHTTQSKRNSSLVKVNRKRKSSVKDDATEAINEDTIAGKSATVKTISGKAIHTEKCNSTFESQATLESANPTKKRRQSRRLSHLEPETPPTLTQLNNSANKTLSGKKLQNSLNTTFDKTTTKLDSTFDKINPIETKQDTTFDKSDEKITSKSSLISSDGELNCIYNKNNDISSISLTSDDSKTENIINTTPVLIESSLEASQLENTPKKSLEENPNPITPLKREGTFTKDGPENTTSPLPRINYIGSELTTTEKIPKNSFNKTPEKSLSLGTPGSTPFPNKSSQKKSVLNITRSIEKGRRSSLAEQAPRSTKVMFCSPIDFPLPTTENKRKIVKSSLKGSNKSFVFDDSLSSHAPPSSRRKRSYTHDEGGARAKRSRLADELQMSVERLSRPRTTSAAAKLSTTTPTKKPVTPVKPRTKLPNFAALHQKQFDKMESLDECQERKAKRARQLLTTTGSVTVLERSSPKGTDSPRKSKEFSAKKIEQSKESATKKVEAPKVVNKIKESASKKLEMPKDSAKNVADIRSSDEKKKEELKQCDTTMSIPSGYTRFGFKMNIGVNPFSMPQKLPATVSKPKEKKLNGQNTRATLPSLMGTTSLRKDTAKQIVMREKSFTSLSNKRDTKRTENRTIIKGVRTNRRFELQMKMRNIDG